MPIKIICGWCGKDLGEKEGDSEMPVSHGICDQCAEKELKKIREIDPRKTPQEAIA